MDFNNNSGLTNEQVSLSDIQNNKKGFDIRSNKEVEVADMIKEKK